MVRRTVAVALAALPLLAAPVPAYAAAPSSPQSVTAYGGPDRARVTWQPADDGGSPTTGYDVYRSVDGGSAVLIGSAGADATAYVDTDAPTGPSLTYSVAQRNADGASAPAAAAPTVLPPGEVVVARSDGRIEAVPEGDTRRLADVDDPGNPAVTPAASPDGKWIAYGKRGDDGDYDIYIRAADGTGPERQLTLQAPDDTRPAWSPDSLRIAFVRGGDEVWAVQAAGGKASYVTTGSGAAWLADSRTVVAADGVLRKVRLGSAAPSVLMPGSQHAHGGLSVSPNGAWIAFTYDDPSIGGRRIALVPASGSRHPSVIPTDGEGDTGDPVWRGDGRGLYAENNGTIEAYSWSGGYLGKIGTIGPGLAPAYRAIGIDLIEPARATRTTAAFKWVVHPPYAESTCRLDGGATEECPGSWERSGLAAGRHTLYVTVSRPGVQSRTLAHTWTVDLTPPAVTVLEPPRDTVLGWASFRYRARDDEAGLASYDVRYRRARYDSPFGGYWLPNDWQRRPQDFVYIEDPEPGYEYCFSARARDRLGNLSAWSAERCDAAPADDRRFSASPGWTRGTGSAYYEQTYTSTVTRGARLTLPGVGAHTMTLVAMRCPTCGHLRVWHAGEAVASFDLAAPVTEYRARLPMQWSPGLRSGPVTIEVLSSGKTVRIDGLAVFRK
jgi:hypothetical protein